MKHSDYPHEPGTLWTCPACETECFCDDGTCVYCARVQDDADTLVDSTEHYLKKIGEKK